MDFEKREVCPMREKINELFDLTGLEQVLLFNRFLEQPYFHYFSQLPLEQFQGNALLLIKGKKPIVTCTFLDCYAAKKEKTISVKKISSKKEFIKFVEKKFPKKEIGINYAEHSLVQLRKLKKLFKVKKFVNIQQQLEKLREQKTKKEIASIRRAVELTEKAMDKIPSFYHKGMTERDLAIELECFVLKKGANGLSFPIIVASGKHSAIPHYITSNKKIQNGFLLVDFGVRYKNYCADLSRTFFVGRVGKKEKEMYSTVFRAKTNAEEIAKASVKASALFDAANTELQKAGFKMVHALGHGIGLQDHDFPTEISKKSKWLLKPQMCLAIEPAVYGKFGGIRLEDNYVMKKKKLEKLSSAPKELIEL